MSRIYWTTLLRVSCFFLLSGVTGPVAAAVVLPTDQQDGKPEQHDVRQNLAAEAQLPEGDGLANGCVANRDITSQEDGAFADENQQDIPLLFHPPGMWAWDNWFVRDGDQWHAFYLQLPHAVGADRRWKDNDFYKHVGHATSRDLVTWQDRGPAICALSGTWNDRHIATGSIARHAGKWWMFFTGRGTGGDGIGLAVSVDLMTWNMDREAPLFPLVGTWDECPADNAGVFASKWKNEIRNWVGIADPYVTPEPDAEGWFTMILNARVVGAPLAISGCLGTLKSKDLRRWEEPRMIAWPECFERMETPQLWERDGRWYLSFGGVLNGEWVRTNSARLPETVQGRPSHKNYAYVLADPDGPADEQALHYVDISSGHYIMKVLRLETGEDVALFTHTQGTHSGISRPYAVVYQANGAFTLSKD
jgi:hypothetical protein